MKKATSAKPAPRRASPARAAAASRSAGPRPDPRKSALSARRSAPPAAAAVKAESKPAKKSDGEIVRPPVPRPSPIPAAPSNERSTLTGSATARTRLLRDAEEPDTESDAGDASSLLAGPRNVKPYVAKRGEQYMSKQQLAHFQLILLSWKRDLMEEVDRTVSHMKDEAANFPDPNDRATQEEEFSLELRTRDRERKLIRKIDEALKRIEDGTYGYCLETGEEIGIKRLEARPVATLSIEAQERRERRERQYGDRDDRYR
ncbi:MAG TPA: RNA polymerase-binding protein DksA [Steroidobacteraceae bacterium]